MKKSDQAAPEENGYQAKKKCKQDAKLKCALGILCRFLLTSLSQGMGHLNLPAHFRKIAHPLGKPHVHAGGSDRRVGAHASNPGHIRQIIGHLHQRCGHNRECQLCQSRKDRLPQ